jgi:hypothetical protein
MKTQKKYPIVEPNCALLIYLQRHLDDCAAEFSKTLWTTSALATSSKLKTVASGLWEEADRMQHALTAYVKVHLPEVGDNGSPAGHFLAEMSSSIEECPLREVMAVIDGIYELLPQDSVLLPKRTVAQIAEGQELAERIKRFLANFDLLLEQLRNDSLEDWDFRKDFRERLDGKDSDNMPPAEVEGMARKTKREDGPQVSGAESGMESSDQDAEVLDFTANTEPKTRTLVFTREHMESSLQSEAESIRKRRENNSLGSAEIHDADWNLCFDDDFYKRFREVEIELENQAVREGRIVDFKDRMVGLIWAGLVDEERSEFPTVNHFRGYFDAACTSEAALAIPLYFLDFMNPEKLEACS